MPTIKRKMRVGETITCTNAHFKYLGKKKGLKLVFADLCYGIKFRGDPCQISVDDDGTRYLTLPNPNHYER